MLSADFYRLAAPRTIFFTLRFFEPRAYSRGFSGFSAFTFLRAARRAFLRSSLVSFFVFAMSAVCFSSFPQITRNQLPSLARLDSPFGFAQGRLGRLVPT
jgi:hypothetical protein